MTAGRDFHARVGLAENPAAPPALLAKLAMDQEYIEASTAAKNPACPEEVLAQIARADTPSMRAVLFENPACSTAILEEALHGLIEDALNEDVFIRKASYVLWMRSRC